jgi:PKD repeat protein
MGLHEVTKSATIPKQFPGKSRTNLLLEDRTSMFRAFTFLFAIMMFIGLVSCSGNGPVNPGPQGGNPNPPQGGNPGSTIYQLQAYIDLSRTVGNAPLPINMTAVVKGGLAPYYFRWDVDGDKAWDYGGIGVEEIGIQYASAGMYAILLEVEDSSGQLYQAFGQVQVKPSGPAANPIVLPTQGKAPLKCTLDGSNSEDLDGKIVKWEWDFNSDGIYDFESTTESDTEFTYETQGTYNATLRVTDDDGFTDVASAQVVVL